MVTLADILTAIKNLVQAVSNLSVRRQTSDSISGGSGGIVLATKSGTLLSVSVIIAGTTPGTIYNAAIVANATPDKAIAVIPNTVGVVPINAAFSVGLVIVPGTGQSVNASFALDA